jgi:spore coat protein U-like protein
MKRILFLAVIGIITVLAGGARAAPPLGFSSANITVTAVVAPSCQEGQHGSFPNPITIDTQSVADQTFAASVDETVKCTSGTVFTVKVTSGNGTAVNQTCTTAGVSSMALKSAGTPADTVAYTFACKGDTDGLGNFTGAGYNTAKALGMSIKVLAANAQAAVAHADYADTVTLTVSY